MTASSGLVALDEDHHVHSTFSDDAVSTVADDVRAARDRGLRVLCLADHVRQGSAWVPDFVAAVRELRPAPDIEVLAGVEAKILNTAGELDLPPSLRGVDRVLIADHQYPGDLRPGAAAGHAGRAGAPPVLGRRGHRRTHRGHPRGPAADRPAAAGPPVQPAAQDGPGRGGRARPGPGPPGPGLLPGRGAGGGQREVGLPVPADDPGPGRGRGAPGGQHRQPRLRQPSAVTRGSGRSWRRCRPTAVP